MSIQHLLTIDLEEYFQSVPDQRIWDNLESRIEMQTHVLLDLLVEFQARATFFVVGWVAERQALLLKEIIDRGHYLACHSFFHRLVYTITPREFREETRRACRTIEQISGCKVRGYRAPCFSITPKSAWALDILCEEGLEYDSSIFPIVHDKYGWYGAPRFPHRIRTSAGEIWEFPPSTFRLFHFIILPVGGGGYLRILPTFYNRIGLRRALAEGHQLLSYFHPWELDPKQPRFPCGWRTRLRHFTGLDSMMSNIRYLLAEYSFIPIEMYLKSVTMNSGEEICR